MIDKRLVTFLKLCEVLNYRVTAEQLIMTQPAVTQHIQGLERDYNCKLFSYNDHNLTITPSGKLLQNYARSAVYNEEQLCNSLPCSDKTVFRLGATKTIGDYVITDKVTEIIENENLNFSLIVDNTERLLTMLNNSELDIALIEGFFDKSQYESQLYRNEEFVGICSENHPFANKEISLEQAFCEKLITRESGSGTRAILEQILSQNNYSLLSFKSVTTISSFEIITKVVKDNHGISFVYNAIPLTNKNIATFRIKNKKIYREFNYVFLKNTQADKFLKLLK